MQRKMQRNVLRQISVAIQLPSSPGLRKMSAEEFTLTWFQKSKYACLVEARSFQVNTVQPWQRSSIRCLRTTGNIVRNWPMNGIIVSFPKTFSEGLSKYTFNKTPVLTKSIECQRRSHLMSRNGRSTCETRLGLCFSSLVHIRIKTENSALPGQPFLSIFMHDSSHHDSRYETSELGFLATRKEYRKGPNNVTDVWTKFIEGKTSTKHRDITKISITLYQIRKNWRISTTHWILTVTATHVFQKMF